MRALAIAVFLGCSAPPQTQPPRPPADATVALVAPGLRLPDDVIPLGYDLRVELDPETTTFRGSVAIRVRVARPTDHVWLHVQELELGTASWRQGGVEHPLRELPIAGDEMRAFSFGATVTSELTLAFAYTGQMAHDEEGVFRQRDRGSWYLYTQAESVFARRILPCFDEPRWKVPWRVRVVVPHGLVALGNTAEQSETVLADGRREVAFAETPPMPSYLLALAVGPFALVDAGTVGQGHVPMRVAVAAGDAANAGVTAALAGKLVASLERYLGEPLPWPKLDLVAVPHFFGAMENPGLVTFQQAIVVGDPRDLSFADHFARIAAHELAHQWFGNWVTPAWWDDLWLAEAFATWLGDKVTAELGALDDPALQLGIARRQALAADADPDARPLRRALARSADAESTFDAISYEKGAAVLAMFEAWLGPDRFRGALRGYLHGHGGGIATSADVIAAIVAASNTAAGDALRSLLDRAGAPVVELAVRCEAGAAELAATARAMTIPVCVRTADGRTCGLVGEHATLALAHCPAWVIGNAGGDGYYHVAWRGRPPLEGAPTPRERLARGDDLVAALARGELAVADAVAALAALASIKDGYAVLAALGLAAALDPLVPDATRPRWQAWLAARFADRLTFAALASPPAAVDLAARDAVLDLVPPAPAVAARARVLVDRALAKQDRDDQLGSLLAIATHDRALFDRLAGLLATPADDAVIEGLGEFGPELAPRVVELVAANPVALPALHRILARGATRTAAWQATRDRLDELLARLTSSEARTLIAATESLCDAAARAEVAAAFAPHVGRLADGQRVLDHTLAVIDRCIARRTTAGDISAVLPP